MGKSKEQIEAEVKGIGLVGDSSATEDPRDPRHRRNAQGTSRSRQRFNQDQFEVIDNRVNLRLRRRPLLKVDLVDWRNSEADGVDGTIIGDIGIYSGPIHLDIADESYASWKIPNDMDRTQKAVLTMGVAQKGAASGANVLQIEVFPYIPGTNGATLEAAPAQTLTASITATTTTGDDHAAVYTLIPGLCFGTTVTMILFRATVTTKASASTDFVMHHAEIEYTTRYYHTHERVS